jgi:hypothetical protein
MERAMSMKTSAEIAKEISGSCKGNIEAQTLIVS